MKSHKIFRFGIVPVLLVPALIAGLLPARANAATLIVTSTADPGVGGCKASGNGDGCTLREAIIAANNQTLTPGDDTIDATGISGAITLLAKLPVISTNIVLNGPGATSLTVRRSNAAGTPEFRIFTIDNTTTSGPTVSLSGFTITGGKISGSGGGIYNDHGTLTISDSVLSNNSATNGGAICNDGSLSVNATLTLRDSTITTNTATKGGGGLFNNGSGGGSTPLSISDCVFTANTAINGGAILNDGHAGGSATIIELSNSVLNNNTATGDGGAIKNDGITGGSATLVMSATSLSINTAVNGGAIENDGTAGSATQAITYSTFNANTASGNGGAINNDGRNAGSATLTAGATTFNANTAAIRGGAIRNNGVGGSATVAIDNSTLKDNTASGRSAAIDSDGTGGSATLALGSTILDNGGPSDNLALTAATFTSKNHNLSSDNAEGVLTAGNDRININPKLDLDGLQDNGGPTRTIALRPGSPAIDQGLSSFPTDQRGYGFLGIADIGAFEFDGIPPVEFRVDALIKKNSQSDTAYAVNDLYEIIPHGAQIEAQNTSGGATAIYQVKVQNDTNETRTFGVQASETTGSGWSVTYTRGTLNISAAIRSAAGYTTGILAPGQSEIITIRMTADGTVSDGASKSATIYVSRGGADQTTRDAVTATTTVVASTTAS